MKKIIISVSTDLISDQRVHKMSTTLHNSGYDVLLVGRKLNNDFFSKRPYRVKRFNLKFRRGFLFYMFFNIRLFIFLLFNKCDIFYANDLDTLLPNFIISKIKNKPLVYDSHELFTEVPELIDKKIVKSFWLFLEKKIFPKLSNVITVSDSIANFYKKKYQIDSLIIKNVPYLKTNNSLVEKKYNIQGFNPNKKNIIYQGSLNKDRGISIMIDTMVHLNANLFIVGSGDFKKELLEYTIKKKLINKIFFLGRVPFQQLKSITCEFDLGLSFEEDTCLAYRYSLPNKIFDYLHAEIPILASDFPDISSLVINNKIGEVLSSRNPKQIASQIEYILKNKNIYNLNFKSTKKKFCWENQEKKIIKLFNNL